MEILEVNYIKTIWSSIDTGWESVESYGATGGILTLWDKSKITVVETIRGRYCLSIKVSLCKKCCWVTNVYGSCGYRERKLVSPEILTITECGEEAWCLGGDFNITRWVCEVPRWQKHKRVETV